MQNNKRIAQNTIFLFIRMFFVLIVSLYTSRLVLHLLGVSDYGVYTTVAGFVSMFNFLGTTLTASVQRFYNFEGARDVSGLQKVYSASLIIHLILAAVMLVAIETFGLWYLHNVMVVPTDRIYAAQLVFQASALTMVSMLIQIPYSGAVISAEKMNFYAFVSIVDVVLKLIAVLILPYLAPDKLILYSFALAGISVFDFFAYYIYAKTKILRCRATRSYSKELFKSIISFSGWNLFGTFVFMLKGQGCNLVLNYFFGPVINAARGVANQVSAAVGGFSVNIMTAFQPQVVDSYSREDIGRTRNLMFTESKIAFFIILCISAPVIANIDFLLHLWLGEVVPANSGLFASLVLIDVLICTLNTPCTQVISATGKLKSYQIGTSAVNIFLIPLCCLLLYKWDQPCLVFIATIAISVINQAVSVFIVNKQFPLGIYSYFVKVIFPCLISVLAISLTQYTCYLLFSFLPRLVISILSDILVAFPVFYWIMLHSDERGKVLKVIKSHLPWQK